nr:TRAP transporter substrate-binding protein [Geomicrobium sp. JCM 19039]
MSNGELGEMMDDYLLEAGLRGLGFWDGGFKQLTTSTHAIESIEDLSGLTMRVSQSPLLMSQFQSWGATGVSVDFSELYTSLQQGTVDGQENPLSNIVSQNLYEAQSFLTYSDHGYMGYVLMISDSFYQDLPGDLQVIIEEVADETTEWQFQQSLASDAPMLKR